MRRSLFFATTYFHTNCECVSNLETQMLLKCEIWLKKFPVLEFNPYRTNVENRVSS